jgi:hypothetical protein
MCEGWVGRKRKQYADERKWGEISEFLKDEIITSLHIWGVNKESVRVMLKHNANNLDSWRQLHH